MNSESFESSEKFDQAQIRAAAVYCSDGRFGAPFDDFLHRGLQLPRYDRLAVPGGAACLAGHFHVYREEEGVVNQLKFLMEAHQLEQVVLIAHEHCAFYAQKLGISPIQIESQQLDDLQKAIRRVRSISSEVQIQAFIAKTNWENKVRFDPVKPM